MRKRILLRCLRGFVAVLSGVLVSAAASSDFREFVGTGPIGLVLLAVVPPLVLALDKLVREWRAS